jgi:hypothetical protein
VHRFGCVHEVLVEPAVEHVEHRKPRRRLRRVVGRVRVDAPRLVQVRGRQQERLGEQRSVGRRRGAATRRQEAKHTEDEQMAKGERHTPNVDLCPLHCQARHEPALLCASMLRLERGVGVDLELDASSKLKELGAWRAIRNRFDVLRSVTYCLGYRSSGFLPG